jgi:hypothetical protein
MQTIAKLSVRPEGSNGNILLWIALGLGVVCLAVILFGLLRREKRKHGHRTHSGGLQRTLTRPFRRIRAYFQGMVELHHQRAEHRKWAKPKRRRKSHRDHEEKSPSDVSSV